MRFIHNASTDPAFNLAAEEWLLHNSDTDVFMLWRNSPAIIVGRNQNTLSQINEAFVRERTIPVIRRISGGGAVFHDLGNLNFTFISLDGENGSLDFRKFTEPILNAMREMGVNCEFDGRNDLVIDGLKFSGNAQHILGQRVLHHGTLLFSSQMEDMAGALRINPEKYKDKAVRSIRSRVTNIAEHLPRPMTVEEFAEKLMSYVCGNTPGGQSPLSEVEIREIEHLAATKYRSWDWNYGFSPDYGFTRATRTPGGVVEAHLDIASGTICGAKIFGEFFGTRDVSELEGMLIGCRHERQALTELLKDIPVDEYIRGTETRDVVNCLF